MDERVFWNDSIEPVLCNNNRLPAEADVAIVGAGITGLVAARELALAGKRPVVLERQCPGWGASSRNGGMVLTGLKLDGTTLLGKYGRELAQRLFAASLAAIDAVEALVQEERIACDFSRTGHLVVAAKAGHMAGLEKEQQALRDHFNHPTRLLERSALGEEIGSTIYHGGLVDEQSGAIHPAHYVAGLAAAADRAGAALIGGVSVERIKREGRDFFLQTSNGTLRAAQVLIASGGYTGRATPALRRRIFPLGSYTIVTEPLSEELANSLIPRGRMVFDTRHLLSYYRLTPDRRMLFGGRAAFFPETPRTVRESAAMLQHEMQRIFPRLRRSKPAYAWGGTLDAAFDLMPHAGIHDGLHFALGYAGHGVALATYLGRLLGRQLLGHLVDNPFADLPFPGAPLSLYNGRPWFLPFAGLWYRLLDQLA